MILKAILKNKKILLSIVSFIGIVLLTTILLITFSSIRKNNNLIKDIYVSNLPTKLEYEIDEEFDIEGLVIHGVRNNGKIFVIDNNELIIRGFDSSKAKSEHKIYIEYQEHTTYFVVSIKEKPKPTPLLVGIELEKLPDKLIYKVGEKLDVTGGILVRKYSDGSKLNIGLINSYIYGYTKEMSNTPGTYTLTVKYVEKGILAETTFEITIEE